MIRVPLAQQTMAQQSEETKFVEVREDKLPADVSQMITFLSRERAGIEYWLEIAVSVQL